MKGSSYGTAFLYVIMKVMEELLIQRIVGLKDIMGNEIMV